MKKVIYISIILLFAGISMLQAGNDKSKTNKGATQIIHGKIKDAGNGELLAGVSIKIEGLDKEYFTDLEGRFQIVLQAEQPTKLQISSVGYENAQVNVNQPSLSLELELKSR